MSEEYSRKLRQRMVDEQLRSREIYDPLTLGAMSRVPRERFVRSGDESRAYDDNAMGIGYGQTISQPYMVALMTQCLELTGAEKVLEVGTGSGYQAAVLAEIGGRVYTIERVRELSERAARLLGELGYQNVHFRVGDGTLGWPEESPFDRIIVTAGAPAVPDSLTEQLASPGILVIPVGEEYVQSLLQIKKDDAGTLRRRHVCDCVFVKLIGEEGWRVE
jgi:protein-L-isoaspartate(D-aspartate) O-methyltransferase